MFFNIQMKYPELKKIYDAADSRVEEDLQKEEIDNLSQKDGHSFRKQQAELRMKKFQQHSVYDEDTRFESREAELHNKKFIGKYKYKLSPLQFFWVRGLNPQNLHFYL